MADNFTDKYVKESLSTVSLKNKTWKNFWSFWGDWMDFDSVLQICGKNIKRFQKRFHQNLAPAYLVFFSHPFLVFLQHSWERELWTREGWKWHLLFCKVWHMPIPYKALQRPQFVHLHWIHFHISLSVTIHLPAISSRLKRCSMIFRKMLYSRNDADCRSYSYSINHEFGFGQVGQDWDYLRWESWEVSILKCKRSGTKHITNRVETQLESNRHSLKAWKLQMCNCVCQAWKVHVLVQFQYRFYVMQSFDLSQIKAKYATDSCRYIHLTFFLIFHFFWDHQTCYVQ